MFLCVDCPSWHRSRGSANTISHSSSKINSSNDVLNFWRSMVIHTPFLYICGNGVKSRTDGHCHNSVCAFTVLPEASYLCRSRALALGRCAPAPPPVGSGPCRPCAGVLFVLVFSVFFPSVGVGRWDRDVECCGPFLAQVFDIQFLHKRESDSLLSRRCLPKTLHRQVCFYCCANSATLTSCQAW